MSDGLPVTWFPNSSGTKIDFGTNLEADSFHFCHADLRPNEVRMDTCEPCFTTTGSLRGAKASKHVMDPCYKSIPLVCCRSQPHL